MTTLLDILEELHIGTVLAAVLLIVFGFFLARVISFSLTKAFRRRLTRQQSMLLRRFSYYSILVLFFASAIQQLGFHINALLGATGILTVAIGIASQTSIANIISGIFIIGEKPFEIGSIIKVNDIEGEVISIDLLSVKIRTYDNMMVRVPNETLVKSSIINISYFPKRRIDVLLGIAYKENLEQVKKVLFETAEKSALCLTDPSPSFLITGLGDFGINIKFCVWASTKNFNAAKNNLQENIKNAFILSGIDMSQPTHPIYIGGGSEPLPIKILS